MGTSKLDSVFDAYGIVHTVTLVISAFAITCMSFMIVVDVFLRYVFNSPLPASVEISQLFEPYVVFLPFAYTLFIGRHVRVTLLTSRLPRVPEMITTVFTYLADFVFFSLICYYAWLEFWHSFVIGEIMFAAIRLPWWVGKFAMALGTLIIAFQCALHVLDSLRGLKESG